jgi:hypothetical protein
MPDNKPKPRIKVRLYESEFGRPTSRIRKRKNGAYRKLAVIWIQWTAYALMICGRKKRNILLFGDF